MEPLIHLSLYCSFDYPSMCLKISGYMAKSVDPDQMMHFAVPDLGLHYLLKPICWNIYGWLVV